MDARLLLAIMARKLRNVYRFLAIRYTVLKGKIKSVNRRILLDLALILLLLVKN